MRSPPPQTYRSLAVAALIVLAGCSGLGLGGDGGTDTPGSGPDSVTPAPAPTTAAPTGTDTPTPLANAPPGIGPDGIEDRRALMEAFERVVENRTYSVAVRASDAVVGDSVKYTYRVEDQNEYALVTDDGATTMAYGDSGVQFERDYAFGDGDVRIESDRVAMGPSASVWPWAFVWTYLRGSGSVDTVDRNGSTFYRVRRTSDSAEAVPESNYTMTAYVRADGFVKTVDVAYDRVRNGTRARVERRWTFALDTGPVSEPDWVTRTRNGNLSAYSAGEYPPGIDESGLADLSDLWNAHRTHLALTSFTLTRSGERGLSQLPPKRTIRLENRSTHAMAREHGVVEYVDPSGSYELLDGLDTNTSSDDQVSVGSAYPLWVYQRTEYGALWLRGGNSSVERVARNGSTLYRLTVERPPDGFAIAAENFTATALVRPDGLIREIRLDVTARDRTEDNELVWTEQTYRYRYHDIGSTTVTEPDWLTGPVANRTATPVP